MPQVATSKSETQSLPHWWKPVEHCRPQTLPSQVAIEFGEVGQAVQLGPHVAGAKFETHWVPQRWYPALHVNSQVPVALQVGVAFATPAQFRQREPHAVTVVGGTQLPPQRFVLAGHTHWLRLGSQI